MTSDRRQRQKEARVAAKEAERKAAARKELWRRVRSGLGIGVVVAVVLLISGLLSNDDGEPADTYLAFRDLPTACEGTAPDPVTPMSFTEPDVEPITGSVHVVIVTSCGEIRIELDPSISPASVESFVFLAESGYYDGTVFHRIASDFVIQGGDQTASGSGNPGYSVIDEFPADDFTYERGVVAMAKAAGRNTTGSQFFIVVGDEALSLSPTFNVLGRVVDGEDTLERISAVSTTRQINTPEQSRPLEAVYIESITIER